MSAVGIGGELVAWDSQDSKWDVDANNHGLAQSYNLMQSCDEACDACTIYSLAMDHE